MNSLLDRYRRWGKRSRQAIVNVVVSFGAKGISILVSMLVVPMTIHYVSPTKYGIWLTLSSIISWVGFFDLGLGNGMRNKIAEAKAKGNNELAQQYVSTTYFTVGAIVSVIFLIVTVGNQFVNWAAVLNVDAIYTEELRKVFGILASFFCLNMVVRLFSSVLTADQRPGLASLVSASGQILSLAAIFILTKFTKGSLINLAVFYAGIPTLNLLCWGFVAYHFTRYKQLAPRAGSFRPALIKNILGVGFQFFLIYLCMLAIFQIINIVISRELGPESVTQYNVAYKYFNIIYMCAMIVISPFWSAFTDAYHKNDFKWMIRVKSLLEKLWLCSVLVAIIMIVFSRQFYHLWIGNDVKIELVLSIGMAIYILMQCLGAIYMNMINGIGFIRLQTWVYIVFALVSYPLMKYSCHHFGLIGILAVPTACYLAQAIVGKIQLEMLLHGRGHGIWRK